MARVKQFADDLGISKNQAQTLINKGRSRKDGGSQILESVMKPKKYGGGGSNKVTKLKKGDNSKATMGNFKNLVSAAVAGKISPKEAEEAIKKLALSTPKVTKRDGGATDFGILSVKAGIDKNPKATQADRIAGAKMKAKPVTRAKGGGMAIQGLGFKGVK
jgi:Glu-tRNA(Gln) amidotransferase subunit E-like FAD-binding protein